MPNKKIVEPSPMPAKAKSRRIAHQQVMDMYEKMGKAMKDEMKGDFTKGVQKKAYGGAVKKMRNGGCVMSGRGGSFKGMG